MSTPAYPTLCPTTMPDATAGVYYEEDMTFWLPANFDDPQTGFNVDFEQMSITSIQGLPFGLDYEADHPNGIYYPQIYEYGCARICGTALSPGSFSVTISVLVEVDFNGVTLTVPQQFVLPLTVLPGTGGNNSFTFAPSSGCDTVCATLDAQIDGAPMPTFHTWIIGTDTLTGPQVNYCFSDSGANLISLETVIMELVITDLYIDGVNDNWCGDVEEPDIFGCTLAPDLYFVVTDGNGNDIHTSSSGTDSEDEEWHGLGITLNDPPYSIHFWDEDLLSGDDLLGTFNLPLNGAGTYAYNVAGGTNGTVVVGMQVFQTFMDMDSVLVYPAPTAQLIHDSLANTVALPITNGSFTWFMDGDTIPSAVDSVLQLGDPGQYWAQSITAFGCTVISDTFLLCPNVALNVDTTLGLLSVPNNFVNYQWYLNGSAISGATDPFLVVGVAGTYWVVVTDANGCVVTSNNFMDVTGIDGPGLSSTGQALLYPSPGDGQVTMELSIPATGAGTVEVFDLTGRRVAQHAVLFERGVASLDLGLSATGTYALMVQLDEQRFLGRFLRAR